jgi:hypothetical protein
MNQAKKRRRFIPDDDESSSSDESSNCTGIQLSTIINERGNYNRATSHLKHRLRCASTSSSSVSIDVPVEPIKNISSRTKKTERENKICDDSSSVDTAELLRIILKPKHSLINDTKFQSDAVHGNDKTLPYCSKITEYERQSKNPPEIDRSGSTPEEFSVDIALTSTKTTVEIYNRDEEESVETAELVRLLRQPVDLDPPLFVPVITENRSKLSTIHCNNLISSKRDMKAATDDFVMSVTNSPVNITEINIPETAGLAYDNINNEKTNRAPSPLEQSDDDEFVLPEQSDNSDDDSLAEEQDEHDKYDPTNITTTQNQRTTVDYRYLDSNVKNNHHEEGVFQDYAELHFSNSSTLNAGTSSSRATTNCHNPTRGEVFLSSTTHEFDDIQANDSLEFDKENICTHRVRNANSGIECSKIKNRAAYEESIENFSDDEYAQDLGLGEVTKVILERRQCRNHLERISNRNDTKSLKQQCITTLDGRFALGRYPDTSSKQTINPIASKSSNGQSSIFADSKQRKNDFNSMCEHKNQVMNQSRTPAATLMQHTTRPRRIRDPSARPIVVSHQQTNVSSAKRFRVSNDSTSSILNTHTLAAGSAMTSAWERNDVFGGSGVGAGSYQMHRQPYPNSQTIAESASVIEVDTFDHDDTVAPKNRRPVSRSRSFKKASADDNSKEKGKKTKRGASRSGGRRGKWGWKKKGKRMSKETSSGRSQNDQRRHGSTWAGNTDDPQLRHVGGAEMSF